MVKLQYFNKGIWETISTWYNEGMAWASLGGDTYNYRVIDQNGKALKIDEE